MGGPRGEVSLDLALGKNLAPGPDQDQDPTAQNLDQDQDPSQEEKSGLPLDPVVRTEKQRKLAVAPSPVQDPSHLQKTGINPNPGPDHTQRLLRKWNKMAENQSPQKTETIKKILSFFEVKINVLFSASLAIEHFFRTTFSL